jgi:hypothetical protein
VSNALSSIVGPGSNHPKVMSMNSVSSSPSSTSRPAAWPPASAAMADRATPTGLDPRGPRVAAAITTAVLALALLLASPLLLAAQAAVFAIGVLAGPGRSPYALVFKHLVRPRLSPPDYLEEPAAPRFAQACGLAFSAVGLLGFALGVYWLAVGAIALALAAAFLNAAFDYCLGCEVYLRGQRLRRS